MMIEGVTVRAHYLTKTQGVFFTPASVEKPVRAESPEMAEPEKITKHRRVPLGSVRSVD
jgi:hypothetical protein